MKKYGLLLTGVMGLISHQAAAISIVFDYSYDSSGFFADTQRVSLLNAAGNALGSRLQDTLGAITPGGVNTFDASFINPGTGSTATINNYNVLDNTLVIYVGGRDLGSTLGIGGSGGFSAGGTQSFIDSLNRGQTGVDLAPPTDFGPWGGSISFNSTANWYFDTDLSTDADIVGNDFYSVALHELGHVLGLGTAGSWDTWVNSTDATFTGNLSTLAFGSAVPLYSDLSHWNTGTMSTVDGVAQEAAMDPNLTTGTRKLFTELDYTGLGDVGWEVSAVPVPAAVWLFGSGLLGLLHFGRRNRKS
ncbi:hypothetical protein MNBD_GAMMA25-1142 [hydrothermal vent metagenome]|uniref:Peptidase M10 metallopeptidase domain-containing protein n=1 Tax=hydrothermal vent metagenome TaxID=652676 RepID=A0A3B1BTA9_9ZZZZ